MPNHPRPIHAPSRSRRRPALEAPLAAALLGLILAAPAGAFCGFYVGKADADLWNDASQVVIARDGDRTVLTMSNDYQGELSEFALVVPVPVVLQEGQINVGERAVIERLDAFSAPRLVEYHDADPCMRVVYEMEAADRAQAPAALSQKSRRRADALGVTIEAAYTVGEYDILILSAEESSGLETWLREEGYRLPRGVRRALQPYIRQGLKFFVAKVNLEEQARTGFEYLRPLQMAFESPRFMLPIRLGMANARGPQDLVIYMLTRRGRVETTNYRTARVPTGEELPTYLREDGEFVEFYRAMFEERWKREGRDVVFLEHFWDMGWCDPCAADPLSRDELRKAGVFWLDGPSETRRSIAPPRPGPTDVRITRLHVRYDEEHFPEDLFFKETDDRTNFQARYVLRHPFEGEIDCEAREEYLRQVRERQEREAQTLANLTGWDLGEIRKEYGLEGGDRPIDEEPWWRRIFR